MSKKLIVGTDVGVKLVSSEVTTIKLTSEDINDVKGVITDPDKITMILSSVDTGRIIAVDTDETGLCIFVLYDKLILHDNLRLR